jgi:hypothetical protein
MRKVHQKFMIGVRLFEEWHMVQALALAEGLVRSEDEMDRHDGYSWRGLVFEDGGLCSGLTGLSDVRTSRRMKAPPVAAATEGSVDEAL